MKEFSFKSVIGQNEAGFDKPTQTKALTEAVAHRVDREVGDGNYYDHIPERYRPAVDEIVLFNSLDADPDEVAEGVSRRWLVRESVVPRLLEDAGFRDVQELPTPPNNRDFDISTIAGFTEKGTVIIVGRGGLMADGGGTAVSWNPLPERTSEPDYVPNLDRGARIIGAPVVAEPLEVRFNEKGRYDFEFDRTAPLIRVFKGPGDAPIREIEEQIKVADGHLEKIRRRGQ